MVQEERADLLLISEQNRDRSSPSWYVYTGSSLVKDTINLRVRTDCPGDDSFLVRCEEVIFFRVYRTSVKSMCAFQNRIAAVEGENWEETLESSNTAFLNQILRFWRWRQDRTYCYKYQYDFDILMSWLRGNYRKSLFNRWRQKENWRSS